MQHFQLAYREVDLSQPSRTAHGLYWYNLQLVFVNDGRWMETRESEIRKWCEMIGHVAFKGEHRLSRLSLLCDHVHLVIGCKIDQSPEGIALVSFFSTSLYSAEKLRRKRLAAKFALQILNLFRRIRPPPGQARMSRG